MTEPDATFTTTRCPVRCRWDPPFTSDFRQFVNLPATHTHGVIDRTSPDLELVVHTVPRRGHEPIGFRVVPHSRNPAGSPSVTLTAGSTWATATDAGGTARLRVTLPIHGGLRFRFTARTRSMDTPVESSWVTIWRGLFYQITEMDPPTSPSPNQPAHLRAPPDMISELQQNYRNAYIELEQSVRSTGRVPYSANLSSVELRRYSRYCRRQFRDRLHPFKLNIVMCDRADIDDIRTHTDTITGGTGRVSTGSFTRWPEPSPSYVETVYQISGETRWLQLSNPREVSVSSGQTQIHAEIPNFNPAGTYHIRIQYRIHVGRAGGWGGRDGMVYIPIGIVRSMAPRHGTAWHRWPTGAMLLQKCTHEVGHALGLVPSTVSWHDSVHTAGHCQDTNCVMWWNSDTASSDDFCTTDPGCEKWLKEVDLSTLSWL